MKTNRQRRGMTLIEVLVMVGIVLTLLASTARLVVLFWDWPSVWQELQEMELWQVLAIIAFFWAMKRWESSGNEFK